MTMKRIYKYPIPPAGTLLALPQGAEVLTVQLQAGQPQMWCLVDPAAPPVSRRFVVAGTGFEMDTEQIRAYVGTWQEPPFVWHLFEMQVG